MGVVFCRTIMPSSIGNEGALKFDLGKSIPETVLVEDLC